MSILSAREQGDGERANSYPNQGYTLSAINAVDSEAYANLSFARGTEKGTVKSWIAYEAITPTP